MQKGAAVNGNSGYEHQGSCAAANGSGHWKRRAQLRSVVALSGARAAESSSVRARSCRALASAGSGSGAGSGDSRLRLG